MAYRSGGALKAVTRGTSGGFGAAQDLGAVERAPELAGTPQGLDLLAWRRTDSDSVTRMYGASSAPGAASFSAPVALGDARGGGFDAPRPLHDGAGNAVIAWLDGADPAGRAVRVAGYDGAGPVFGATKSPSGSTGVPNPFFAAVGDALSPLAAVSWAFGDGTSATGGLGTHAYRRPGTYDVRITATDALGNSSTALSSAFALSPALSRVSIKPARFAVARGSTPVTGIAAAAARGTNIRFRMSRRGRVRMEVLRQGPGRRLVRKGTLRRVTAAGSRRVRFGGRLGRRALSPGRYVMRLRAIDGAGNLGKAVTRRFTVVRR